MQNLEQTVEKSFLGRFKDNLSRIRNSVAGKIAVYSLAGVLGTGLGYGCGEEPHITIEGTIYLQPAWMRSESEKLGSVTSALSTSSEYSRLSQGLEEFTKGTGGWEVNAWCATAEKFEECGKGTVDSNGKYKVDVPLTDAVILETSDGEGNPYATYLPNPISQWSHDTVPPGTKIPATDMDPASTASTSLFVGIMQEMKEDLGKFNYNYLTSALGIGAQFFATMPEYFKEQVIKTTEEYFTAAENDTKHQEKIGEAYNSTLGRTGSSKDIGSKIIQKAKKVDLGGGNYIEFTEETTEKQECAWDYRQWGGPCCPSSAPCAEFPIGGSYTGGCLPCGSSGAECPADACH